jgi:protein phosphatase
MDDFRERTGTTAQIGVNHFCRDERKWMRSLIRIKKSMRFISAAHTDIGKRRKINQDAYLIDDVNHFYIVADGMGGHAAGEIAARESVEAVHDMVVRGRETIEKFLEQAKGPRPQSRELCRLLESAVQSATYLVYGMAEQSPNWHGMGTTVSAILMVGEYAATAQVGDTRIYRLRKGEAVQLTEDHTLVNWQIREGVITPEEAKYSPHKNVITRAVGNKDYVQVDTQLVSVRPLDKFLICSDGLHTYVGREELVGILENTPEEACKTLVDMANARGGKDNITAVIVHALKS